MPAAHGVHAVALNDEYVPAAHVSHVGLPFANVPGLHAVQDAEPDGLTEPDAHTRHDPTDVPGLAAYRPTAQAVQPPALAGDQ